MTNIGILIFEAGITLTVIMTIYEARPLKAALPQKSDYSMTFGANCISASKIILTD
jgi:hypothetical protein